MRLSKESGMQKTRSQETDKSKSHFHYLAEINNC